MRVPVWLCAGAVVGLSAFGPAAAQDADVEALFEAARTAAPQFTASESVVTFDNEGESVVGTLTVPEGVDRPPVVLLFHGFTGQRHELAVAGTEEGMFGRTARRLAEQGYASLRIDFRGSGESGGEWPDTTFTGQIDDALAAVAFVERQDVLDGERIGVVGLSQGGLVAAALAARAPGLDSVVLWSAVASPPQSFGDLVGRDTIAAGLAAGEEAVTITLPWGAETSLRAPFFADLFRVDPVAEITRYPGPLLVVVGTRDDIVWPQPQAGELFLQYHRGPHRLVALDADHVFDVFTGTERLDEAIAWTQAWFDATLR